MPLLYIILDQAYTSPRYQVAQETEFCIMVPNTCGPSVWNLLHVSLLAVRILRQLLECWKICGPQFWTIKLTKKLPKREHSLPILHICTARCNKHLFIGIRNQIFKQSDKWLLLSVYFVHFLSKEHTIILHSTC
jgi:hypothetical protein